MNDLHIVVTIEARLAATRLPGKVLFPLAGEAMLTRLVERVRRSRANDVVVASTSSPPDQAIEDLCHRIGCRVHRGSVEDISQRLLEAANGADVVVQITGDCPLIDPAHIDKAIDLLRETEADYVSNSNHGLTFPLGLDVRASTMVALQRSMALSSDPTDRVHGSYFIARRPDLFRQVGWSAPPDLHWPDLRLTVDEPTDYELVRRVFEALWPSNPDFDSYDIVRLLRSKPDWVAINSSVRQKNPVEG